MSPKQHPAGEGPADPAEARKRVKDWWDKPEHGKKSGHDERNEATRNDDLTDATKGGKPNP
ncbi:MAG TPA: hypothetical protein VJ850_08320 [Candidatus Limnocylindrales bacterium]|nr:hypothetical protein [Candidatus Limnocylindrales bacterium]